MIRALLIAAVVVVAAAACGPVPAKDVGAQLFSDPTFSGSEVNAFSCATCHAVGQSGAAVHAGFDLRGAAKRTRFWGGYSVDLLDATNACVTFFMRGAPITKDDPKGRALYEYLADIAKAAPAKETSDMPLTIVENITSLPKGAKSRGQTVWDNACRGCHGDPHTGNGRITPLATIVPEDSITFGKQIGFSPDLVVIEKIRHGAFFGVGGTMPPFTKEQMSDDDVGALLSFLGL